MQTTARMVTRPNGVVVLELTINGSVYGEYPISEGHNAVQQLKDMMRDTMDYGGKGILLWGINS